MKSKENAEIIELDPRYRPISAWGYFRLQILYSIPVIGVVFLLIHAIGSKNINKKNFAKSYFCVLIIALILVFLLYVSLKRFSIQ